MAKRRDAHQYSAEEFNRVVALINKDAGLRSDIEAITGQSLKGKNPRELFDLFRAVHDATDVQLTVAAYGRARQQVRETRAMLAEAALDERDSSDPAVQRIRDLEAKVDELKAANARLRDTNKALMGGRPVSVIKGEVSA
jgi:hypothetical protein